MSSDTRTVAPGLTRWRLDLAYDGTGFSGWSAQPGRRTVEGELERWLTLILRPEVPVALTVAGRTDAGVHARGQVAHVDLPELENDPGGTRLAWRLRRVLPGDIQLRALTRAPDGFDARFSAVDRRYCYRLWDTASTPDPLCRVFVRPVSYALDVALMNEAGTHLLGLHDFAPFCKPRPGASTIRTLQELSVRRAEDDCGTVEVWAQADAFCHSMVRCLVGALTQVGSGRRDLAWLDEVAGRRERASDVPTMPPGGLTLEEVVYPPDAELARRAVQARSRRSPEEVSAVRSGGTPA